MKIHYLDTRFIHERLSPAPRALVACGLWLRAGLVAACVAAIALVMLANGEASAPPAIASAVAASIGAAFAWRRAWVLIGRYDDAAAPSAGTASARPRAAGFGAGVESVASH